MDLNLLSKLKDFYLTPKGLGFDTKLKYFKFESEVCCSTFNSSILSEKLDFISNIILFFESLPSNESVLIPNWGNIKIPYLYFTLTADRKQLKLWFGEHSTVSSYNIHPGWCDNRIFDLEFSDQSLNGINPFITLIESLGYMPTTELDYYNIPSYYKYTKES
jgi:hypothetical protein